MTDISALPTSFRIGRFNGGRLQWQIEGIDYPRPPRRAVLTLQDCFTDYLLEHCVPTHGDPKRADIAFADWTAALGGDFDCTKLKREHGRIVVKHITDRGVSPATARKHLVMGAAALRHAKREERLVGDIPKFAMPDAGSPRATWLTPEQYRTLMQLPKPRRRMLFWLLAFQTGCRTKAIETLPWSRVDLRNRLIDFREPGVNHKNKRRPIAPINDILLPRLAAAKEYAERNAPDDPYVIGVSKRTGRPTSTYNGCKKDMVAIGVDEEGIARHVARHTFCSWRVQAGFSYAFIGALVGDKAAQIERTYGHLAPQHLMDAANMNTDALRFAA